MLNKKFIVKLISDQFRQSILSRYGKYLLNDELCINEYAHYIVDQQILTRSKIYENDKKAFYGFSPIAPICVVMKDGTIQCKLFEMNQINHFLKELNGEKAVEVAQCILLQWYSEAKKQILNFNVQSIDAFLTNIEKQFQPKDENEEIKESK